MNTRAAIIILVIFTISTYFIFFSGMIIRTIPMTESEVNDLVKDRYPTARGDPVYDERCIICDVTGCHEYGEPCWRITHEEEDESGGKVSVESSIDETSGNEITVEENECTEWWCDAEPCDYNYSESINSITHDYTNYGCDTPSPTCDQDYGLCRQCSSNSECIMSETYEDGGTTVYIFSAVGTNGYSIINDSVYICQAFDDDDLLMVNTSTVNECQQVAEFYAKCGAGGCKFEPSFGMIPY